jgi:hypothetical protein
MADKIETYRLIHIEALINVFYNLVETLSKEPSPCSYECSSILLGAWVKRLVSHDLSIQRPILPYRGLYRNKLQEILHDIAEPEWRTNKRGYGEESKHPCTLKKHIEPLLKTLPTVDGLNLFYFVRRKEQSALLTV